MSLLGETIRVAYADPPYLGTASRHYGNAIGVEAFDTAEGHSKLIDRLTNEFPDGWALSMGSVNLRTLLPLCPDDVRVGSWCKPFASFKPGVNPAYCWEPVVWRGGRKASDRLGDTTRDYCTVNITLKRGFTGAKPDGFCWWMFDLLGLTPDDELIDLFPGSGAVSRAWEQWCRNWYGLFPKVESK